MTKNRAKLIRIRALRVLLVTMMLMTGCDLNPARDNPLDPLNPGYRAPGSNGRLLLRVLTLAEVPIPRATVTLFTVPQQVVLSDSSGLAVFGQIPAGEWTITANKFGTPDYASSSRQVTINAGVAYETTMRLDALPSFVSSAVNALATETIPDEPLSYQIYLKSRTHDADGPEGLSVKWEWADTANGNKLEGAMEWAPESLFYHYFLPSDSLPGGNADAALGGSFTFYVTDPGGQTVASEPVRLVRVLHQTPYDLGTRTTNPPTLEWAYRYGEGREFTTYQLFDYLVQVFKPLSPYPDQLMFDTLLAPQPPPQPVTNSMQLPGELPPGMYYWYVLVIDKFGNSVRTHRETLYVGIIPSRY